jgi:L-lysine exporter family protein LysE/ArgO
MPLNLALPLLLTGLATGLSLIVAIGAQNAYVLRTGLTGSHIAAVVAICIGADVLLILAGVAGVGTLVARMPDALTALRWIGAAYLIWYGIRSLMAARDARALSAASTPTRSAILTILALTFLNPHVYLDTVLMLGNLANLHGPSGRWWFAAGACLASTVWFVGLGFGARSASRWASRPTVWRVLDVLIGITMFGVAALLISG